MLQNLCLSGEFVESMIAYIAYFNYLFYGFVKLESNLAVEIDEKIFISHIYYFQSHPYLFFGAYVFAGLM